MQIQCYTQYSLEDNTPWITINTCAGTKKHAPKNAMTQQVLQHATAKPNSENE